MQLVNIGFGNIIAANKIVAIVSPESAPIKRMIQEAKDAKTAAKAAKEAGDDAKAAQIMDDYKKYIKEKEDEYNKLFCNPYNAARYGYIDDVIEPRNTRFRICHALAQLATKRESRPAKKHGCMPT